MLEKELIDTFVDVLCFILFAMAVSTLLLAFLTEAYLFHHVDLFEHHGVKNESHRHSDLETRYAQPRDDQRHGDAS